MKDASEVSNDRNKMYVSGQVKPEVFSPHYVMMTSDSPLDL